MSPNRVFKCYHYILPSAALETDKFGDVDYLLSLISVLSNWIITMEFRSGYTLNPFENLKIINAAVISGNNRLILGTPVLTIMHLIFQVKSTVFALKLQSLQLPKSKQ